MIPRYITAILRDQFNLFFRFGFTDIPSVLTIKANEEIDKLWIHMMQMIVNNLIYC